MMQPGEGYFIINKSYVSDLFCLLKADVALINPKNENEVIKIQIIAIKRFSAKIGPSSLKSIKS